ncbi:flagellar biosynthesis protein FlhF [Tepidibacter formicigenes]|jgi:flagellar biosynthesis protein FlhF|uniref:Flagellar biosynthesis protein FlhF n=1 Tax=Tepidibacter formicigenes DSM 15518 TaxID=1123349 RepID=A0A1M6JAJ9_9FIRM|nr:flagellar biosynthesis protein FlhF [Tepidibacter formicigenes]SHJ43721.1 flagellar biosynthesis protein FlhF [Tepidibacter formicigenes DSM 15518]
MQIKKFIADNAQEAIKNAKNELGDNAVILHTKKIKTGGVFGLFKKEKVEVLAALEKQQLSNKSIDLEEQNLDNKYIKKIEFKTQVKNKIDKIERENEEVNALNKEIQELKKMIRKINNKVDINFNSEESIKIKFKNYYKKLKRKGLSDELIENILCNIESVEMDDGEFKVYVEKYLLDKFKIYNFDNFNFNKKVNIFIGTTGVGKTTTLAKLASEVVLKKNKKVGFLTLDTYRISAVDQLKTYADILNAPIEVAYDINDVSYCIEKLKNRDLIFVDTAGRSHKNKKHMKELKVFLDCFEDKEIFLVLSANWNIDDIKNIINEYSFLKDYKIIVTKLDETDRIGIVLDILNSSNKPIAYTTFGQNVPDDIEKFDIKKVVNEVLRR